MDHLDQSEIFVQQLTEHQNRLYGYVYSLLGDHSRAADVIQETNLVLWRKIQEYDPGKPFLPWAFSIARFQVLAHIRDKSRDKLLLDDSLAESLSTKVESQAAKIDVIQTALRPCLEKLSAGNNKLVDGFYFHSKSVNDLAKELNKNTGAIKTALLRVRKQLAVCVEKRMAAENS